MSRRYSHVAIASESGSLAEGALELYKKTRIMYRIERPKGRKAHVSSVAGTESSTDGLRMARKRGIRRGLVQIDYDRIVNSMSKK